MALVEITTFTLSQGLSDPSGLSSQLSCALIMEASAAVATNATFYFSCVVRLYSQVGSSASTTHASEIKK